MSDYREYLMRAEETQALAANVHAPVLKQVLLDLVATYQTLASHAVDRPESPEDAEHLSPGHTLIGASDRRQD